MVRAWPNIVVTGTPGTGKSTLASILAEGAGTDSSSAVAQHLKHINVSSLVRSRKDFQLSYDEEWDAYEPDEDAILDELEPQSGHSAPEPSSQTPEDAQGGGLVLDWHTNEVWPERWVDLVVVLRTDHTQLCERLEKRCVFRPDYFHYTRLCARSGFVTELASAPSCAIETVVMRPIRYKKIMRRKFSRLYWRKLVVRIRRKPLLSFQAIRTTN